MDIANFQEKYKGKRVAIAHEYLQKMGGAERVVKTMLELFPRADVYTLAYNQKVIDENFAGTKVVGSLIMKIPGFLRKFYKLLFPIFPRLVERWDFSEYDLIISSSSAYMHGLVTNLGTKHVCYYHSPTRYLWDWHFNYIKELGLIWPFSKIVKRLLDRQREWDFLAAQRPELVLGNSEYIVKRINKFYRRDACVLYPPVSTDRFKPQRDKGDFYLYVGTLSPYKNVELAVKYFSTTNKKFLVVGQGKDLNRLKALAADNISFVTDATNEEVAGFMQNAKGFIFPGEDDFGIVMVEALASGTPVFAFNKGGATEIVDHGKTGRLFSENNLESFSKEFARFEKELDKFQHQDMLEQAQKFTNKNFLEGLADYCDQILKAN